MSSDPKLKGNLNNLTFVFVESDQVFGNQNFNQSNDDITTALLTS